MLPKRKINVYFAIVILVLASLPYVHGDVALTGPALFQLDNSQVLVSGSYTFDDPILLYGDTFSLNMSSKYSSLPSSQFECVTSGTVTPRILASVPVKPTYVLNALNYSWGASSLVIYGQLATETITVSFSSISVKLYASTAILTSAPSWDGGTSVLSFTTTGSSSSTTSISGFGVAPYATKLNGYDTASWGYTLSTDTFLAVGAGSWWIQVHGGGGGGLPITVTTTSSSVTSSTPTGTTMSQTTSTGRTSEGQNPLDSLRDWLANIFQNQPPQAISVTSQRSDFIITTTALAKPPSEGLNPVMTGIGLAILCGVGYYAYATRKKSQYEF